MAILEAENITKTYLDSDARLQILRNINLSVAEGEFVCISGQSGCGKSTLLHILGLLDKPDSGTVTIDGMVITPESAEAPAFRNARLGFVFQFHYLMDDLNAMENVALPLLIAKFSKQDSFAKAEDMLCMLNLGSRLRHYPHQLSGGEQQRVALARALINHPGLVLADEPTGNLDPEHSKEVLNMIFDLNQKLGKAFIMVTHDMVIAARAMTHYRLQDGILLRV